MDEPKLQLITSTPDGWCDPETGVCHLDEAPPEPAAPAGQTAADD
jgi:hypothetical protein